MKYTVWFILLLSSYFSVFVPRSGENTRTVRKNNFQMVLYKVVFDITTNQGPRTQIRLEIHTGSSSISGIFDMVHIIWSLFRYWHMFDAFDQPQLKSRWQNCWHMVTKWEINRLRSNFEYFWLIQNKLDRRKIVWSSMKRKIGSGFWSIDRIKIMN